MILSLENKLRHLLRKNNAKKCIFFQKIHTSNSVLLVITIIAEATNVYQ